MKKLIFLALAIIIMTGVTFAQQTKIHPTIVLPTRASAFGQQVKIDDFVYIKADSSLYISKVGMGPAATGTYFLAVASRFTAVNNKHVWPVYVKAGVIYQFAPVARAATITLTVADMLAGVISSISAAAVSLTMPTATLIAAAIPNCGAGTLFDLLIDNSGGANTVTMVLGSGITNPAGAVTTTAPLTVTTTHKVGMYRFYFTSATAAIFARVF